MANLFGKTLQTLVVVCVASQCVALAQDNVDATFQEAVRLLRSNQRQAALAKLEEVLKADPSHEDAFRIWSETDAAIFHMLLAEQGEFEKIAKHIMSLATIERRQLDRDQAAIDALVEQALADDYGTRSNAIRDLVAAHGEFAVPALLVIIGDENEDKRADRAMFALTRIGHSGVLALIEALQSDNDLLRRNVAATMVHIDDSRAAPAFARLLREDSNDAIREIALRGLQGLGVAPGTNAVDLYIADARAYLTGGARDGEHSEVVWTFSEGALVPVDVPAPIYELELAKARARDAVRLDPANTEAQSLLARAYLAEVAAIEDSLAANPDDETMQPLADKIPQLRMVAMAAGPGILRKALVDSIRDQMVPVAVAAIVALGEAEDRQSLASSPLVAALRANDSRICYAAALALARAGGSGGNLPNAGLVVQRLGEAVTEEAIRLIKVVDGNPLTQRAAQQADASTRGLAVDATATAQKAIADIYSFPHYDVVVVAETLPDALPQEVISLIRKRAPSIKILLLATSEDAAERFGDKVDGIIEGELTGEALIAKANEVLEEMDSRRARATAVAIAAGEALRALGRANVDLGPALSNLEKQLDREDGVAVPAAQALGEGGNAQNVAALIAVLKNDGASAELKIAGATAIGGILGRASALPAGSFDELIAIAADTSLDAKLRSAVVTALGKGRLAPGERLKLTETLATIATGGGSEG